MSFDRNRPNCFVISEAWGDWAGYGFWLESGTESCHYSSLLGIFSRHCFDVARGRHLRRSALWSWSFSLNHGFGWCRLMWVWRLDVPQASFTLTPQSKHTAMFCSMCPSVFLSPNICFSPHVLHHGIIFFRHFITLTSDSDMLCCFGNFRKDFRKHPSVPVRTVPQNRTGTLY